MSDKHPRLLGVEIDRSETNAAVGVNRCNREGRVAGLGPGARLKKSVDDAVHLRRGLHLHHVATALDDVDLRAGDPLRLRGRDDLVVRSPDHQNRHREIGQTFSQDDRLLPVDDEPRRDRPHPSTPSAMLPGIGPSVGPHYSSAGPHGKMEIEPGPAKDAAAAVRQSANPSSVHSRCYAKTVGG